MKGILTLLFLFALLDSFAQKADTSGRRSAARKPLSGQLSFKSTDRPLIKIDDVVYRGTLDELPQDNIESIDVIRGKNAAAVFGPAAKDGAVLIKTKKGTGGQLLQAPTDYTEIDVDGKAYDNRLGKIPEEDIFDADSSRIDTTGAFGSHPGDLVVIITKKAAVKGYEEKLSKYCKAYSVYIQKNKDDDSNLSYVVDGVMLKQNAQIRQLYNLSDRKIKSVRMINTLKDPYASPRFAVLIITNRN